MARGHEAGNCWALAPGVAEAWAHCFSELWQMTPDLLLLVGPFLPLWALAVAAWCFSLWLLAAVVAR